MTRRKMRSTMPAGARKAVRKSAVFQIFAKRVAHKGARCVGIPLAVELACAGQRMPGLEVLGYGLVQQGSLCVAPVVEFGLTPILVWSVRLRL